MGTPFRQPKEFAVCRCGAQFERTVRKGCPLKKFCERCIGNERYKQTQRRGK